MAKSQLYTGTGDAGTTSLVGGKRIKKNSTRLEAYGTVDEFSAHLGLLSTFDLNTLAIQSLLSAVQNRLFDVGAYLATDVEPGATPAIKGLTEEDITDIEHAIDALDEQVPKANAFVLPGGTRASAEAHIARTVCRRAERRILAIAEESYVDPLVIRYFNRLSDWLFILSRHYNHAAGVPETTWHPAR